MRPRTPAAAAAVAACLLSLGAVQAEAHAAPAQRSAPAELSDDFNGDGYPDLAIGTPDATVNGHAAAGSVVVTYGTPTGVNPTRRTVITQDSSVVRGAAEAGDRFGHAITSGDLDGDGYADLAVSSLGEDIGAEADQGSVSVIWGGPNGFTSSQTLTWGYPLYPPAGFGRSLVVGRFDGDDKPDLAIMSNFDLWLASDFTRTEDAKLDLILTEASEPVFRATTIWGSTSGDADGDGQDELIAFGSTPYAGLFRLEDGEFQQIEDWDETIGSTGDFGDLNDDGYDDLVVGDPAAFDFAGKLHILWGHPDGIGAHARTTLDQAQLGLGINESGDRFGYAISAGDVNGDGFDDFVAGAPGEGIGSAASAGSVVLVKGRGGFPQAGEFTRQAWHQDSEGIAGVNETGDQFGHTVRIYDADANGLDDLAVTAPYENAKNGTVWRLPGTHPGLTGVGSQSFDPPQLGVTSTGARFGLVLNH